MKFAIISIIFFAASAAATWTYPQKLGVYTMVQRLAQVKTGTPEEHIVYEKLSIFFNDWLTSAQLRNPVESADYRNALFSLLAQINAVRSEAISDPAGVDNLEFLISRIRRSYGNSLGKSFKN